MAEGRSIGVVMFKWLVVPGALAAVGYFLLGPRLGSTPLSRLLSQSPAASEPSQATEAPAPQEGPTTATPATTAPDVKVDVRPVVNGNDPAKVVRPRKRRRRRKRAIPVAAYPPTQKPAPATSEEQQTAPPPTDQVGSGGVTTTGTTG